MENFEKVEVATKENSNSELYDEDFDEEVYAKVNEESTLNKDSCVLCNGKEVAQEVSISESKEVELHIAHKVLRLFKEEVRLRGVTKALFNAMALYNFVHYTSEVLALVALYVVRFVDVNPLSSRSFALKYKTSSISSLH